jgi:hypothetical protein
MTGSTLNASGGGGGVTSIATTAPILGGTITTTGTISLAGTDINSSGNVVATHLSSPLPILQGGTGTTTPSLVAGTNTTVSGTWPAQAVNATAPIVIGFILLSGVTGTNIGPMLAAARTGSFTKCVVTTKASDGSTALTFKINQNGTNIFSVNPTVAAGTSTGTVSTFTTLTSSPLPVAANDVFSIDVTSGTSTWQASIQLE